MYWIDEDRYIWPDYPIVLSLLAVHGPLTLAELYELMKVEGYDGNIASFKWLVECEMVPTPGYPPPEIRWFFDFRKDKLIEVIGFTDYYARRLRQCFLRFEKKLASK